MVFLWFFHIKNPTRDPVEVLLQRAIRAIHRRDVAHHHRGRARPRHGGKPLVAALREALVRQTDPGCGRTGWGAVRMEELAGLVNCHKKL